ncbi:Inorganic pyrophosphatase [Bifidobacterium sp. DSM 109963]|uniref:Inorganic pyrophosphatase n=1 Tax=Bifidobacterium panos TaxID=2675321 RepID=A0ABX1SZD7_9BIFI|nr:Inorganic pyrophosphatase [Bifidobacterium sp. DSM 109963]
MILRKDLERGRAAYEQWGQAARHALADGGEAGANGGNGGNGESGASTSVAYRASLDPEVPRSTQAMAVRYSLHLLERKAPGPGVEVRVAPWGAVKILDGPASDPHNLTPPDVIELEPNVWLRLACGITTWSEERQAGHISAVGERDDLSELLPL